MRGKYRRVVGASRHFAIVQNTDDMFGKRRQIFLAGLAQHSIGVNEAIREIASRLPGSVERLTALSRATQTPE